EIILRPIAILVGYGYFCQDEQRSSLVSNFFVQRLLCQLLRSLGIPRRQPLLGREQHSPPVYPPDLFQMPPPSRRTSASECILVSPRHPRPEPLVPRPPPACSRWS